MHNLAHYIAHSNVANFLILAFILALVFNKAIKSKINEAYDNSIQEIEDSEKNKAKSFEKLAEIKSDFENLNTELEEIVKNSKEIITNIETRLKGEFEEIKEKFSKDANKIIERQIENINSKTKKEISQTAINKAEDKLKNLLTDENNHRKFIASAIDEIDKLEI